jgi:hypothetical protein
MKETEVSAKDKSWCVREALPDGTVDFSDDAWFAVLLTYRGLKKLAYVTQVLTEETLVIDLEDVTSQVGQHDIPKWAQHDPEGCKQRWRNRVLVMEADP